ncbi:hypothetical protein [Azospirillum sp. SYSU D00513]|nr:hypothetical protein [Azospirillum sp. SYSU D00513]
MTYMTVTRFARETAPSPSRFERLLNGFLTFMNAWCEKSRLYGVL